MAADAEYLASDQLYPELRTVNLSYMCGSRRFAILDALEAYYRCTQYDGRKYDWNGAMRGYGQAADIAPGWYVPLRQRRPSARYDLPRLIVRRFSSMIFGTERFPQIIVDGDEDAQDYVRALSKAAKLPAKMLELRNKGGAQGAAGVSFGFIEGLPRVTIHNAKHITILSWADRYEQRPKEVLESYSYQRTVWDQLSGKPKEVTLYFARYWSEDVEVVWDPIPAEVAREPGWMTKVKSTTTTHGYGFCPFYWVQNLPDCDGQDGDSDYEGQCDTFDEVNTLLSATGKGTVANVDPTLVIKDDRKNNTGQIAKGSENAIWSKGGAEYLELKGESLKAALALLAEYKQEVLDTVGVVLGDPDKMGAQVASAAALRVLYMPMLTQCDILREQYGGLMVQLLKGILLASKMIATQAEGPVGVTADGQRVQDQPTVELPPRVVDGEAVDRVPGESEHIDLNWPPYFPNTWTDTEVAIKAIQAARGGTGPIISRKTAVENVAPLLGIADPEQEIEDMDEDRATDQAFMMTALDEQTKIETANAPKPPPGAPPPPAGKGAKPPPGKAPPGKKPPPGKK